MAEYILLFGVPLIFFAAFGIIFLSLFLSLRQVGRNAKKTKTAAGKAVRPDAKSPQREAAVSPGFEAGPEASPAAEASPGYGSLGYADSAYYGSLGEGSSEGEDPCHDRDPAEWLSGSLGAETMEGEDPCHEELRPVSPVPETPEELPGGLALSWTGDEVVKGFVYGEVLRRKRLT